MTSIPDITLNNGQTIPQFGFGVFQIEPKDTGFGVVVQRSRLPGLRVGPSAP